MEVRTKVPPLHKRNAPQIMAVWPTGPRKAAYECYQFNPYSWDLCSDERRLPWVEFIVQYITDHLRKLGVDLSTVKWEMQYPLEATR